MVDKAKECRLVLKVLLKRYNVVSRVFLQHHNYVSSGRASDRIYEGRSMTSPLPSSPSCRRILHGRVPRVGRNKVGVDLR